MVGGWFRWCLVGEFDVGDGVWVSVFVFADFFFYGCCRIDSKFFSITVLVGEDHLGGVCFDVSFFEVDVVDLEVDVFFGCVCSAFW